MVKNKVMPEEGGDGQDGSLSARKYMVEDDELNKLVAEDASEGGAAIRVPTISGLEGGEGGGNETLNESGGTVPPVEAAEDGDKPTSTGESGETEEKKAKIAATPRTIEFQKKLAQAEAHMNKSRFLRTSDEPLGVVEDTTTDMLFDKMGDPIVGESGYESRPITAAGDDEGFDLIDAEKQERRRRRKKRVADKNKISVEAYNKQYRNITKKKITMDDLPQDVLDFLKVDYFKKLKYMSYYIVAVAIFGLLCMVAMQELTWRNTNYESDWITSGLKLAIFFDVVILCILIFLKYYYMVKQLVQMNRLPPGTTLLGAPKLMRSMFLEILICFYHIPPGVPPPGQHYNFTLDGVKYPSDIFALLMFVRIYLFADVIKSASGIYHFNASFFGTFTNVKLNYMFGAKTALKKHPMPIISFMFTMMLLILSWCVYLCERNYNANLEDYWDAIWMTFITMAVVGYGDVVPVTIFGRLVTMISAIVGILFLCLTATVIFKSVELTLDEHRVTDMLEKAKWNYRRRSSAQRVIKRAWELYVVRTPALNGGHHYNSWITHRKLIKLFNAINKFRNLKKANPFAERADMRSQMNAIMEVKQKQGDLLFRLKSVEGRMTEMMRELVGVDEVISGKATEEDHPQAAYNTFKLPDDFIATTERLVILPQSAPQEEDHVEQHRSDIHNSNFDQEELKGGIVGKGLPDIGAEPEPAPESATPAQQEGMEAVAASAPNETSGGS